MTDRLVSRAWWLALMSMIVTASALSLFIGYRAIFELLAMRWEGGVAMLLISASCAAASMALCRHRNDLL